MVATSHMKLWQSRVNYIQSQPCEVPKEHFCHYRKGPAQDAIKIAVTAWRSSVMVL